jgi:hypothetical protein
METMNILAVGAFCHMILFLVGLAVVSFVALKSDNIGYLWLLIPILIIPLFIGTNPVSIFYALSIILLGYLSIHYFREYKARSKIRLSKKSSPILAIAFMLLTISNLILFVPRSNYLQDMIGHVFCLMAYSLMLANLIRSLKHGKKAK